MAAPSYVTDLGDVTTAENTTNWAELTGRTSGGAATQEDRAYLQGSFAVSQSTGVVTGQNAGLQFNYGSDLGTGWTAGWVFMFWQYFQAPKVIDTWANGGMRAGVGSSAGNMNFWNTQGNDTGRLPYGGWQNVAIDPTFTPDQTDGTPTAGVYQYFGSMPNLLSSVSKGNPHCVDAIRYGRGQITITLGDVTNGYGTFAGLAATNDADANRWGLFQYQAGSYLYKGLLSFGSAGTAVDFRDSNRAIFIDNVPRTYASFNKIEIRNASSRVDWTAISISPLGTLSKGSITMVDNATVNFDGCSFTGLDAFTFQSGATITNTVFRGCGLVTTGGATVTDSTFTGSTATNAVTVTSVAECNAIDRCTFTGNNRAIKITAAGEYNFDGHVFSGNTYDVENASTGAVTINNINQSNASTAINTAGGTTTFVTAVTVTVKCVDKDNNNLQGVVVYVENSSTKAQILSTTTNASGIATTSFNYPGSDVAINIRLRKASTGATKYVPIKTTGTITNTGFSLTATMYVDDIASA